MVDSAQQSDATQNPWYVQQLQLIAFPLESQVADPRPWWQELVGNSDVESTRKKTSRVESGPFQSGTLQLNIDPLRMAWVLTKGIPVESLEGGAPVRPDIGLFEEQKPVFAELMEHWLQEYCPTISRLAFIATVTQWTDTREEAYQILNRYLHDVRLDPASTDFQYRINRKRQSTSGVQGLVINRLSTWSAIKICMAGMRFMVGGPAALQTEEQLFVGCQLQLDMNTAQEFGAPLPQARLAQIWSELVALGSEIAERGDVA